MTGPYNVVRQFEHAVCDYTGAPFCATTNSCTMALLLAVRRAVEQIDIRTWTSLWGRDKANIEIPKRTYVSVPMSIIHAGCRVQFRDEEWSGGYQLAPLPVFDYARRFTSGMYRPGTFQCVSFHASKILGDTQGGAILHDNAEADVWFRCARFDGRTEGVAPKDDAFLYLGWHCYMSPDVAARLLLKLYSLPQHNEDLPNDDYPDLSQTEIFQ